VEETPPRLLYLVRVLAIAALLPRVAGHRHPLVFGLVGINRVYTLKKGIKQYFVNNSYILVTIVKRGNYEGKASEKTTSVV
jgi:hypothetical protein